jgi:hypothetical protein
MALLARFACGCKLRVEIPAPLEVRCAQHGSVARLITMPNGQVRYVAERGSGSEERDSSEAPSILTPRSPLPEAGR